MKKSNLSILILTLAINFISFSQEVKFTELSSITSRGECSSYAGSDGAIYKVGEKLMFEYSITSFDIKKLITFT